MSLETVFVAIWKDRHADTEAFVFEGEQTAIDWAKTKVREYCHFPEDLNESLSNEWIKAGCVYSGVYSCEGDFIRVMKVMVQSEEKPTLQSSSS